MLVVYFSKHVSRNPVLMVGGIVKPTNNQWLNWIYNTNLWIYLYLARLSSRLNTPLGLPTVSGWVSPKRACQQILLIEVGGTVTKQIIGIPELKKKKVFRTESCKKTGSSMDSKTSVKYIASLVLISMKETPASHSSDYGNIHVWRMRIQNAIRMPITNKKHVVAGVLLENLFSYVFVFSLCPPQSAHSHATKCV